jgi:hypothetical protein
MNGMSAELTEGEQARRWTQKGVTNLKALEKHYQAQGYFCLHRNRRKGCASISVIGKELFRMAVLKIVCLQKILRSILIGKSADCGRLMERGR